MMQPVLNLAEVRPWWFRLALLALLGSPLGTSSILHGQLHSEHVFRDIGNWTSYALFLWMFICLCVGLKKLVDWLAVATIFGLTVLITGALFRKLGIWSGLEGLIGLGSTDPQQSLIDLIFRFLMIIAATPFALLVISSFPAADLMRWVSRQGATRTANFALVLALFLRIFQHVGEVVIRCMVAWSEENPAIVLPRYYGDWTGSIFRKVTVVEWLKVSVAAWCGAIAIHSLVVVPTVVRDFRRLRERVATASGGLT